MADHVRSEHPDSDLFCWDPSSKSYLQVSYANLVKQAYGFGQRLLEAGAQEQSVCMIACHSPYATLVCFYGAISVGVIPMIFPMPKALGSHEALSERIRHWGLRFALPTTLVLESGIDEKFHDAIPEGVNVIRVADSIGADASAADWPQRDTPAVALSITTEDIAFFQTTSSSTSWLPLFHDMGLVGTVLFSFCNRYPLYLMTPVQFVKRPALWLKGMSEHQCTIATAPNFGYDYCSRLISDKDTAELDLNCVKHLFIGAEPIRVSTIQSFVDKFRLAGIDENKIRPAYGLAESTIITSISLPEHKAKFICLDPDEMGIGKSVTETRQITFDGMQADIVDENGDSVASEGHAGEIVLSGHSVALGYVGDADNLIDRFDNGRMHTGDMGVIKDGELYIIERIKNIVIRNGENYLVSAIEQRIADLLGTSHEHVAVFETDIHDPTSEIVVLVERQDALDDDAVKKRWLRSLTDVIRREGRSGAKNNAQSSLKLTHP